MEQIIAVADLQVPYHDPSYVKAVSSYCRMARRNDATVQVGQIGDLIDLPGPSRWSKGQAAEYRPDLAKHIDATRRILDEFEFDWIKVGNHDERIELYVERYAPALVPWDVFRMEGMFQVEQRGIRLEREPFMVAPGWIAAHGHEGALSSVPGATALGLAMTWDMSVVCGHTHRAAIRPETVGFKRERIITGMEIGHGMLPSKAHYVKTRRPRWQQAFGVLWVDGKHVSPQLIPVSHGRFIIDGKAYQS